MLPRGNVKTNLKQVATPQFVSSGMHFWALYYEKQKSNSRFANWMVDKGKHQVQKHEIETEF